jgi:hypothetical protein
MRKQSTQKITAEFLQCDDNAPETAEDWYPEYVELVKEELFWKKRTRIGKKEVVNVETDP